MSTMASRRGGQPEAARTAVSLRSLRIVPVTGPRQRLKRKKVIAMKRTTVEDVMTTRVVAVTKDASFKEMIIKIREFRISAFPVVDHEGRVIGVVSEADMLNKEANLAADVGPLASILRFRDRAKSAAVTAGELTSPPVVIGPDAPVTEAARRMRDRRVKRLPVINSTRHLIGIVCRSDVLSTFARPDAEIRQEAAEEAIAESFLVDSQPFAVTVHDGVVTLTGYPETDQAGRELVERVRHIEGVVAVRDRLSYAGRSDDA
jgi:CBS domain-containing protein